jgi:phage terminase large subunit-like protein
MARPLAKKTKLQEARLSHREEAEADFEKFIELVQPYRLLGNIHRSTIRWWTRSDAKNHQLTLLPRDHMKSALIGLRVAWELTKDPTLRILYISSTSNLATKQLKFIKDILTCDNYRLLWPEMVTKEETKREKWTEREISVDHPARREQYIRDPSIFTAGLTSNIVGLHCDIAVLDDVVVQANAYTQDGREKVKDQYSLLSSIETVSAREWVVGTRYHPNDLYSDLRSMEVEEYDELGNVVRAESLFEHVEWPVESIGDGTGEFLWPRAQAKNGRWYGFDAKVLAEKRAQYLNKLHFRAQYYNDPHDVDSAPIKRDQFQYYDNQWLNCRDGRWFFKGARLNVFAAVDFAYTLNRKSDFSCVAVIACDGDHNYYVLEIDRFKTDKPSEYYSHILKLYEKWGFRKIRAEVTAAQNVIVKDLRDNYIRRNGLTLSVEEFKPSRWQGSKEERILAVLEPKYANNQIYHYMGGNCQVLEEELVLHNPSHDDCKDALASAIDLAIPPLDVFKSMKLMNPINVNYHSKFGGVA